VQVSNNFVSNLGA